MAAQREDVYATVSGLPAMSTLHDYDELTHVHSSS